jgi:hypothetical protein
LRNILDQDWRGGRAEKRLLDPLQYRFAAEKTMITLSGARRDREEGGGVKMK